MRIGVLTYHCVPNFGAQLQATSTVGYIRRMGHEAVVLHWYPQDLEDMYAKRIPRDQIEAHNAYTRDLLPVTDICRTEDDLVRMIKLNNLDAIIVGSDALFKYMPLKLRKRFSKRKLRYVTRNVTSVERLEGNPFFGSFVSKLERQIPVVAFSVSSQNCPYFAMTKQEKTQMCEAMSNFSSITVRDEWTKDMVENIMGTTDVSISPDPVFSFNQNSYVQMPTKEEILMKYQLRDNYLLFSFSNRYVEKSYIQQMATIAHDRSYLPVAFPMPEGLYDAGIETKVSLPLNPLDWFALIKYSAGYIGERMHPIVVCLHNAVPFFSFDEYGTTRNKLFGLQKEYVQSSSKTFRILERAGLNEWMHSYKLGSECPSVDLVMSKIAGFDKKRCHSFSCSMQEEYVHHMKIMFKIITRKHESSLL